MNQPRITVDVAWMPASRFFICAKDNRGVWMDARELAYALFAFDERSFYGTLVQTSEYQNQPGITMSALDAIYYFTETPHNRIVNFDWPVNISDFQQASRNIRSALTTGEFTLDYESSRDGECAWRLSQQDNETPCFPFFTNWLNAAITELIESDSNVAETWSEVLAAHSALFALDENIVATDWMDETEWRIAVGLEEDSTPFVIGLQLTDPFALPSQSPQKKAAINSDLDSEIAGENENWHLSVILQDKTDPNLMFEYAPLTREPGTEDQSLPWDLPEYETRLNQRLTRIAQVVPWIAEESELGPVIKTSLMPDEAWLFLEEASISISGLGHPVFLPAWWQQIQSASVKVRAKVKSSARSANQSLFGLAQTVDFDWRIAIGDMDLSETDFAKLVAEKRKLIYFRGRWIKIDIDLFRRMALRMKKIREGKGLTLRDVFELHLLEGSRAADTANLFSATADEEAARIQMEVELDTNLIRLMKQLTGTKEVVPTPIPDTFRGQLRPYQQVGVSWLTFLRTYGLGACLADDMGLGKTVQYIAYLLAAKAANEKASGLNEGTVEQLIGSPSLLICPTSVIGNWQKELARFAPSLRVYVHYGPRRHHDEAFLAAVQSADLVITSYALAHLDEQEISKITFASICLDEAQNIKNAHTKQASSIRKLSAMHRIAMTGTPIENRLTELWSIFDFLNPGYLGSLRRFQERFVAPIERDHDIERTEQIQRLVHPLLLRRVKRDPAIMLDLPEKVETKVYVSLTPEQAALYENALADMLLKLDKLEGIERSGVILTTLLKLKQICNHPANFLKTDVAKTNKNGSNKLVRLLEMVSEVREEGDSCLVFTQFVEMGQLLKETLQKDLGENVLFLHGSLAKTQRDKLIDEFQTGKSGIFILSLKAGGVGLNLTAASHVFHFDRWWNPAVENQATDRAFRIGQTKKVEVHKFVTLGTLEERIDEMIEQKQALSQQIVGTGESWITQMSTNELRDLFGLRREWIDTEA